MSKEKTLCTHLSILILFGLGAVRMSSYKGPIYLSNQQNSLGTVEAFLPYPTSIVPKVSNLQTQLPGRAISFDSPERIR